MAMALKLNSRKKIKVSGFQYDYDFKKMTRLSGFSLLELLIVMVLVAVLMATSYPSYSHHIIKTRRNQAQICLLQLSARLEAYFNEENTYKNASLATLGINQFTDEYHSYLLHILEVTDSGYTINATPQGQQSKDTACQNLSLNELGEKSYSGTAAQSSYCWQ